MTQCHHPFTFREQQKSHISKQSNTFSNKLVCSESYTIQQLNTHKNGTTPKIYIYLYLCFSFNRAYKDAPCPQKKIYTLFCCHFLFHHLIRWCWHSCDQHHLLGKIILHTIHYISVQFCGCVHK